ncbi:MAG: endolytic transglycosylase MltG [Bacteroidetes bacterium]|nr:endolytic transglycosylase MltG [Bacteroidota bacterium]
MSKKTKKTFLKVSITLIMLALAAFFIYYKFFAQSIHLKNKNYVYLYIETDSKLPTIINELENLEVISDIKSFEWLAKQMKLEDNIHPGKYRINDGITTRQIINLIKYAKEEKIKLTLNSQIHNLDEFVNYTADKLELSENEIEQFLNDGQWLDKDFGATPENAFSIITPAIYEISWAISLNDFVSLLKENYTKIWNTNRKSSAKKMGYTPAQIIALASIVQSESAISSEQQKIAGVYINRLKINQPLQADPTLIFANKRFNAQRVLDADKEIDSPYNTYKYVGLPPGPICITGVQAIDAVLNYTKHKYYYFCAKPSLNGYSDFSETYAQHQKFAKAYQAAIEKRGIKK